MQEFCIVQKKLSSRTIKTDKYLNLTHMTRFCWDPGKVTLLIISKNFLKMV